MANGKLRVKVEALVKEYKDYIDLGNTHDNVWDEGYDAALSSVVSVLGLILEEDDNG